jgi:capsular exopolysaccharide synthesis family protein
MQKDIKFEGNMFNPDEVEIENIDLLAYLRVLLKRKWVVAASVGTLVLFAGIYSFKATPIYKATSTMMIEEEGSKILSIEAELGYSRGLSDLRFFNTQIRLLTSKSLLERIAVKLDLLNNSVFASKKKSNKKDADLSNPYFEINQALRDGLIISPVRQTRLVEISFKSSDPALASQIVNTLAEEFIDFFMEKRFASTQQASVFLEEQTEELRKNLAAKERELQDYSKGKDLFYLNDEESAVVNTFSDLNTAYTQAQIDRIQFRAAFEELESLIVDSLPQFVENKLIQDLKTEYTQIKNEYEEKIKIFRPSYPDMLQLKAKLDSMRTQLESEIARAVDAAEASYRTARNRELSLKQLLDQQKASVSQMNSDAILYNSLMIEVENMRNLLNSLVERQKETLVSARLGGLKTNSMSIIDRAEPPRRPVSPKKKLTLILAFIVGLTGGIALCFVLEYFDNTVKGPEDVEQLVQLPSLGMIPFLSAGGLKMIKKYGHHHGYHHSSELDGSSEQKELSQPKDIELINYLFPRFSISEDYRTVRTAILLSSAEKPPKTIAVTSALPQEGKTTTLVNLAVAFSQLGEQVLIVDSDMRKPRIHQIFDVESRGGLSGFLTGKIPFKECVFKTQIDGISVIPSGPIPPNPSELIDSQRMKMMIEEMKKAFDVILLDTPPLLAVVDPVIVASMTDATVFVLQSGKTTDKSLISGAKELGLANAKIIGVVLNGVKLDKDSGYYSKSYRSHYRSEEGG